MSAPTEPRDRPRAVPDTDRGEPQDDGAERAVIGACMHTHAAVDLATTLITGADFYVPAHETMWRAITTLRAQSGPTDPVAILNHLRGGADQYRVDPLDLASIYGDAPILGSVGYYARIVADLARARRIRTTARRLIQAAGMGDPDTLAAELDGTRAILEDEHDAVTIGQAADPRLIPGDTWLLDTPADIPAIWGRDNDVLWARGETLLICGPSGVGKTSIGQQLVLSRIGLAAPSVLGWPVQPTGRVLYLAMDRPEQARRSMLRMVDRSDPDARTILRDRLVIWKGPPPGQLLGNTRLLLELAQRAGLSAGDVVVVDSIKDAAVGIAKDDVGAAVNTSFQELLAADIDVLGLHHIRKADAAGAGHEPATIDEVYGSTWITGGAGSVISIWGAPGDPIVAFRHMKQPSGEVGPYKLRHDQDTGRTEIWHGVDLLELVRFSGVHGLTARAAAAALFPGRGEDPEPSPSEIEKGRRKLEKYVRQGLLTRRDGPPGTSRTDAQCRYFLAADGPGVDDPL